MSKALIFNEISSFLSSPIHFMTRDAKLEFLNSLFLGIENKDFFFEMPTYKDKASEELQNIALKTDVPITDNYDEPNLEQPALAYHRIKGVIMADSRWWFSTKQFRQDLLEADANPQIIGHFVHVTSGGGDAWFLDQAAETMKNLQKPVYAFVERIAASAGLYLYMYAKKAAVSTPFDIIGSMGTMVSFMDIQPYFEKMGVKFIEEYATNSKLKNKKVNDLRKGKPAQYIKEELDPLRDSFATALRDARKATAVFEESHPVMQGDDFYTHQAIEYGLADKILPIEDALTEAYNMGQQYVNRRNKQNTALSYIS